MNITVIGTGNVGLTTGTCLAEMGNTVFCVDRDEEKVRDLRRGELTIYEPGLEPYFKRNVSENRLHFSTDLGEGVRKSELIFLTLPTPSAADGSADLTQILAATDRILAQLLAEDPPMYRVIVNKSTVPVGTADRLNRIFREAGMRLGVDVDVVSNPEFLREGTAVADALKPDRVIVGTSSARAAAMMQHLYKSFVRQGNPILIMDERSAEMTKYAANALLATRVTFMNEIANLCERMGGDVESVRLGVGFDHRIGNQFLYPGIGFGGSYFPKDVRALLDAAHRCGHEFPILDAVLSVNHRQRLSLPHRVRLHFGGKLTGVRAAVWGLSFKANTDDVQESAAHEVVRGLLEFGAQVSVFDPVAMPASRLVFKNSIEYAATSYDALKNVDVLLVCTEWNEFRRPDWSEVKRRMRRRLIFDGRNLYEPRQMADEGFEYHCVGRPHFAPVDNSEVVMPAAPGAIHPMYTSNGAGGAHRNME